VDRPGWFERVWSMRKRLPMVAVAPFLSDGRWWLAVLAVAILGCLLIVAVCWMAKYTDATEVQTPLFTWKRRRPRSKPP
jgi:hypothetical protein